MKKALILLMLTLTAYVNVNAQFLETNSSRNYQALTGEVFLLTLFIETPQGNWGVEEMEYHLDELQKSQKWLSTQAGRYGKSVRFNNDFFLENNDVVYLPHVTGRNTRAAFNWSLKKLGYESFNEFLELNNFDFTKKKLKILFFIKENERSHAYNYFSNTDVDIAVVYQNSRGGNKTDQYVISHELLHQFGAWDLYEGRSQSYENARLAKSLYPNSIMINTFWNKHKLNVDELTAWRIGWHQDYKEEYQSFAPAKNKSKSRLRQRREPTIIKFDLRKKKKNQILTEEVN